MFSSNPFDIDPDEIEVPSSDFGEVVIPWTKMLSMAIEGDAEELTREIMIEERCIVQSEVDQDYRWRALLGNLKESTLYRLVRCRPEYGEVGSDARGLIALAAVLYGLNNKMTMEDIVNGQYNTTPRESSKFMGLCWASCLVELERRNRTITTLVIQEMPLEGYELFVLFKKEYSKYIATREQNSNIAIDIFEEIYCQGKDYPVLPKGCVANEFEL